MEQPLGFRIDALHVPWWLLLVGILLAVVTATGAAWWPGRTMSRIPPVVALSGRPPRPAALDRSALLAAALRRRRAWSAWRPGARPSGTRHDAPGRADRGRDARLDRRRADVQPARHPRRGPRCRRAPRSRPGWPCATWAATRPGRARRWPRSAWRLGIPVAIFAVRGRGGEQPGSRQPRGDAAPDPRVGPGRPLHPGTERDREPADRGGRARRRARPPDRAPPRRGRRPGRQDPAGAHGDPGGLRRPPGRPRLRRPRHGVRDLARAAGAVRQCGPPARGGHRRRHEPDRGRPGLQPGGARPATSDPRRSAPPVLVGSRPPTRRCRSP